MIQHIPISAQHSKIAAIVPSSHGTIKKVRDEDVNAINTYIEDMEILSANCENNQVQVICHGHRKSIGGYFIFLCDRMVVLDEGGKEVTFDELKGIARRYWEGFAQKNTEGIS